MNDNRIMTGNGNIAGSVSLSGNSDIHPNFSNSKIYIGWPNWEENVCELCRRLEDRDFLFVYGIPRGGLTLATQISHRLDIPLVVDDPGYWMLDWYHWRMRQGIELKPELFNILVVDAICDTGKTLKYLKKEVLRTISDTKNPKKWDVTVAVVDIDQSAVKHVNEYVSLKNPREWIVYPWESGSKELKNL